MCVFQKEDAAARTLETVLKETGAHVDELLPDLPPEDRDEWKQDNQPLRDNFYRWEIICFCRKFLITSAIM